MEHTSGHVKSQLLRHLLFLFKSGTFADHGLLIQVWAGVFGTDVPAELLHASLDGFGRLDPVTRLMHGLHEFERLITGKAIVASHNRDVLK